MFEINNKKITLLDGAMGTMLQAAKLKVGEIPELLNITAPEAIQEIHEKYYAAGADIVYANTFGANRWKAEKAGVPLEALVTAAIKNARRAADKFENKYVALDIGPCGRVMKPAGDLDFEEAVSVFAEVINAGKNGADLVLFETFTDLYELKAAIVAAKENCDLPIFATMTFEENGRTFFGATVDSMVMTLEALGVSALGMNCSLGPKQMTPLVEKLLSRTNLPVIVKPNAGLPVIRDGQTVYDVTEEEFAEIVSGFAKSGALFVGGCCGTKPSYIKLLGEGINGVEPARRSVKKRAAICTPSNALYLDKTSIIGERLNPTGKKALKQALRDNDISYILREALKQQDQGADILDVNMGLPDIDEPKMLERAVTEIQAVSDLPLQLDSSDTAALERAARIYNGKPLINSVNGKDESLNSILPIVKKYGCAVLGLTLDEKGLPKNAEERVQIAEKIIKTANGYGIPTEDVLIDCLALTASAQQDQVGETLKAITEIKAKFGVKTVLGVSNISFGLPARPVINRTFLAMALQAGLDAPIMNPGDGGMAETVAAFKVLSGQDKDAEKFIEQYGDYVPPVAKEKVKEEKTESASAASGLTDAILRGLKQEAANCTDLLLKDTNPLEIVEKFVVPALDQVGKLYEEGKIFLPQLIKSAEAAKSAFVNIKEAISKSGTSGTPKKTIVLATVRGDIHDIGKNIAKVILENYNFKVIDLGRDVPEQTVADAVKESGAQIVGLSALMTTTVSNMKETIALLKRECPDVKIMVGGAVLTPDLAETIGADFYVKDAMEDVRVADSLD